MGGRGNSGSRNSSKVQFSVDQERLDSYLYRDFEKTAMREALDDVQNAIKEIEKDPWRDTNVEVLYESLADWFPRSMEGDDAEKVVRIDYNNEYITTVEISLWENREGRIEATLTPYSHSFSEFSDEELRDMGIERRR